MKVPQIDLTRQHLALKEELLAAVDRVLTRGRFILGPEGEALEAEISAIAGVRYGIGVGSGTDAIRLALQAIGVGPGDEVVTSAFSFVASATPIAQLGARPVFADVERETLTVDPDAVARAITPKTRALIPVHLFGHPAEMARLQALARSHGIAIIEDAAQAIGASYDGHPVGSLGDLGCFSFYPTKNLGACGDAGMVVTDREELALQVRRLRDHGARERYHHIEIGLNSRLDEIQAAILRVKLCHFPHWTETRRRLAQRYSERLAGLPLRLPVERPPGRHVYHHYTVRTPERDALAKTLADAGIGTALHYPHPLPSQPVFSHLGARPEEYPEAWEASREVLSLPCFPELTDAEIERVVSVISEFFEGEVRR
ncbi:MAG TPA: DegT/DnrJ/EryC1/StrS family aminotransferase [Methylomirabilota bacterium]|nr:DegT/DnrJ/EryC1/StrS family aminotransferase [Methylomirabilota bacterium]